jgi:hypothetical protein
VLFSAWVCGTRDCMMGATERSLVKGGVGGNGVLEMDMG